MMDELEMKFDPSTIEHLGLQMYSTLPNALAELIANAYDADAENVFIKLYDEGDNKSIIVEDDGLGMSFDEANDKFLIIGRKKRKNLQELKSPKKRKTTGRKGVGKLALFGIGDRIQVITGKKDENHNTSFTLDWNDIIGGESPYKPKTEKKDKDTLLQGTKIILTNLKRKTSFNLEDIAISLSKLFNFLDSDFNLSIFLNDKETIVINNELRIATLDKHFEWDIQDLVNEIEDDYEYKNKLNGKIISTPKPMKPNFRGVTIYANGRLANSPSFFGQSESGYALSYITGWINADYLDEFNEDLIATDRQSLNWHLEEAEKLGEFLIKLMRLIIKKWNIEWKKDKEEKIKEKTGVDVKTWIDNIPPRLKENTSKIIEDILDSKDIEAETSNLIIAQLHSNIIPEFTDFVYRNLHPTIQSVSGEYYKSGDYYKAITQSLHKYIEIVTFKYKEIKPEDEKDEDDYILMRKAFGAGKPVSIAKDFKKSDGTDFLPKTIKSFENAQSDLSAGMVSGYRNPLSHNVEKEIIEAGIITEKHCLDALSILSLLFERLDNHTN